MNVNEAVSDAEFEAICKEAASRMRNIVFMNAEQLAEQVLTDYRDQIPSGGTEKVEFDFRMGFILNDLMEILGGLRRRDRRYQEK